MVWLLSVDVDFEHFRLKYVGYCFSRESWVCILTS